MQDQGIGKRAFSCHHHIFSNMTSFLTFLAGTKSIKKMRRNKGISKLVFTEQSNEEVAASNENTCLAAEALPCDEASRSRRSLRNRQPITRWKPQNWLSQTCSQEHEAEASTPTSQNMCTGMEDESAASSNEDNGMSAAAAPASGMSVSQSSLSSRRVEAHHYVSRRHRPVYSVAYVSSSSENVSDWTDSELSVSSVENKVIRKAGLKATWRELVTEPHHESDHPWNYFQVWYKKKLITINKYLISGCSGPDFVQQAGQLH